MTNFFILPRFDNEDQNVKARLIFLLSVGLGIAILVFVVAALLAFPALVKRSLVLAATMVPILTVILWLLQSLRLRVASAVLVAAVWFIITAGTITAGSVAAPISMGYIFVLIISGLLMRRRTSVYVMGICLITVIIIAWAELNGHLPPAKSYSPVERISIYGFFFVMILGFQNITAAHITRLLRQARESETKYKSFLESIPTVTYINHLGRDAGTEYVSPQVQRMLGYSQEEFLRDPLLWQKIIHPDDREHVLAENSSTAETGLPFHVRYRLFTKDHKVVWVRDEAILVKDEAGTPQYWLGVWTDITTLKNAEDEQAELISILTKRTIQLQTAAEVSRAVSSILDINHLLPAVVDLICNHFDYYYVGIFLVDDSQNWAVLKAATGEMGRKMIMFRHRLSIGDSSMIGWSIAHRQARIALDVGVDAVQFRNPYLPLTRSEMALPLITHNEVIGAMTIQSTMASAFSSVDITALQTMADQVATAIQNARLFAERSSLIDELERRNNELERFTYTVSHDLRSPLVTIRGFLGFLRQDATSGDLVRFDTDLHRIANAVDRMQALLNDLLELSRVGRIINTPEDIPFRQIVDETIDLLSGPLEARSINLQIEENLPTIHGDHTRLIEIMQNLISNAVKFMGGQLHPEIKIGARGNDEDGKPILFVRDNGMGIEPEYHDRIFGLFNRLHPEIEGTGIGLTLVQRIVEVHGGRIWLESQPGEGTTFLFTLPRSEEVSS